uniref:Uncharacterized protein n=1 Tax=Anguilla anguilla TaxID=7936 RepID=A0A0E9TEK5_ANGAN
MKSLLIFSLLFYFIFFTKMSVQNPCRSLLSLFVFKISLVSEEL